MYIRKNFYFLKGNKSLKTISIESGISENTLEKYSSTKTKALENITLPMLIKLCTYFKVKIDDFVNQDLSLKN